MGSLFVFLLLILYPLDSPGGELLTKILEGKAEGERV